MSREVAEDEADDDMPCNIDCVLHVGVGVRSKSLSIL